MLTHVGQGSQHEEAVDCQLVVALLHAQLPVIGEFRAYITAIAMVKTKKCAGPGLANIIVAVVT